jgi:hypothetical protein
LEVSLIDSTDLSQRLEQGCARPLPFTATGRLQQPDSMIGQFAFETTAEVVGRAQPLVVAGLLGQVMLGYTSEAKWLRHARAQLRRLFP